MSKRATRAGGKPAKKPATKRAARAEPIEPPIEFPAPKRGRGQPTKYEPAYCDRVIELGAQGKSKAQIAAALGISRKCLYQYMRVHEEFAEAMKEAEFAALAWWEDVGQAGLSMPKFNAALYAFNMKNRFREFYADKVDVAHTAKEELGAPARRQLSDVDLARRVAFMLSEALHQQQQQDQQRLKCVTPEPIRPQPGRASGGHLSKDNPDPCRSSPSPSRAWPSLLRRTSWSSSRRNALCSPDARPHEVGLGLRQRRR